MGMPLVKQISVHKPNYWTNSNFDQLMVKGEKSRDNHYHSQREVGEKEKRKS